VAESYQCNFVVALLCWCRGVSTTSKVCERWISWYKIQLRYGWRISDIVILRENIYLENGFQIFFQSTFVMRTVLFLNFFSTISNKVSCLSFNHFWCTSSSLIIVNAIISNSIYVIRSFHIVWSSLTPISIAGISIYPLSRRGGGAWLLYTI
jgi:hypothetical protein